MRINRCKWFGHKWVPVFIKGEFNGIPVKFIGCYCSRLECEKGDKELRQTNNSLTKREYGTHYEEYFDK